MAVDTPGVADLAANDTTESLPAADVTARQPVLSANGRFVAYVGRAVADDGVNDSVLRVLTLTAIDGYAVVLWSAVPGRSYRVQFKDTADAAEWTALAGSVTATASTATHVDDSPSRPAQRFYRVVLED